MNQHRRSTDTQTDPEPITHGPGGHPVGTGIGAAVGGAVGVGGAIATGAVLGGVAGPVGMAAGAAVGAVVGGVAGNLVAENIDPSVEEKYWRENYASRPYAKDKSYEDFGPAYRYGWESYGKHNGRRFDDVESDLARDWDRAKDKSRLLWHHAKHATRDAWDRLTAKHRQS
jgi:hypothetical protein